MNYATPGDMIDRFGQAELIDLTDFDNIPPSVIGEARLAVKLGDAQAFVDGYVGQAWRLPLTGCARPAATAGQEPDFVPPPVLVRLTCDIARYYLHDDIAPEHEVYRRYKAALANLEAIASGKMLLACPWGGTPGEQIGVDAASTGEVQYSFSPRQITDDALRGFA